MSTSAELKTFTGEIDSTQPKETGQLLSFVVEFSIAVLPPGTFNLRDLVFRIYDGSTYYVPCPFVSGTMQIPASPPRPADTLALSQGKADASMSYVIEDDSPVLETIEIPMTFQLESSRAPVVLSAMSNPQEAGTWSPDGVVTFAPVTTIGGRIGGDGQAIACQPPADPLAVAGLVDVEIFMQTSAGHTAGYKLWGCYFQPPRVNLANRMGTLETTLEVHGAVTKITAFSSGTAI